MPSNNPDVFDNISNFIEDHQGLLATVGIIITIIVFGLTLRYKEKEKKEETRKRLEIACQLISQEVNEFKLQLSDTNLIVRDFHPEFFNVYFYFDGYESVLHSDLFSHFSQDTQIKIKALYVRIKLHNELLHDRQIYKNNYFLYDISIKRVEKWHKAVANLNLYLHNNEIQIRAIVLDVENALRIEQEKINK
ncbi:MAG: hypothetical protein R2685_12000 [Candidatus Nitrosocosmicus sp.]|nr:hypothetical protein [Candidatus Nitrosocosmicus sp.]